MRFRWPFVRRRRLESVLWTLAGENAILKTEVIRLREEIAEQERTYRVDARIKMLESELADVERARDAARADVETLRSVAFHGDTTWKQVAQSGRQKREELTARIGRAVEVLTGEAE